MSPAEFVNPPDGSLMRLIPGGTARLGSTLDEIEYAVGLDKDSELTKILSFFR
jgi:hypothetical protein